METNQTLLDKINQYAEMLVSFDSSMDTMSENIGMCKALNHYSEAERWKKELMERGQAKERVKTRLKDLLTQLSKRI